MVKLICTSWIPRSHIHLFETYAGLDKITLNTSDVMFADDLSFRISGYGSYPDIYFTQEWSGLHYFVADFPNERVPDVAVQFIRGMQGLLLNEIFKKCHTVTFKQIAADIIPLDFHVTVLSKDRIDVGKELLERKAGGLSVLFDPHEIYSPGTVSYVFGSEDPSLKNILLYHAYVEITSSFLMNMMKRMTRLYHEADRAIKSVESSEDVAATKEAMDLVDDIAKESSESFGKLKQARANFALKLSEYGAKELNAKEKALADALEIEKSLKKINVDGDYMHSLWSDVLIEYLNNVDSTLDARLMLHSIQKKKGLFG